MPVPMSRTRSFLSPWNGLEVDEVYPLDGSVTPFPITTDCRFVQLLSVPHSSVRFVPSILAEASPLQLENADEPSDMRLVGSVTDERP